MSSPTANQRSPAPRPTRPGWGPTAFERASRVARQPDGRYVGSVISDWSTALGPSGGFLAAIAVRALLADIGAERLRQLRWFTCLFHRGPRLGEIAVEVEQLSAGRRVSEGRATAYQDDKAILTALAATSAPGLASAGEWDASSARPAPAPPGIRAVPAESYRGNTDTWLQLGQDYPPINRQALIAPRYGDGRYSGQPVSPGRGPQAGGWIFMPGQPVNPAYLVLLADWWWPAAFGPLERPARAPTIGFAVDVRADLPPQGLPPQPVLARYHAKTAAGGLVDEDAELRLADGTLLARAHQLSLFAPLHADDAPARAHDRAAS
jgi:hypothetical protein